jgi:hypothetical protein
MFNPSRPTVLVVSLVSFVGLVLGLATDVGLFGWTLAALLALYLALVGIAHITRRRSMPQRNEA